MSTSTTAIRWALSLTLSLVLSKERIQARKLQHKRKKHISLQAKRKAKLSCCWRSIIHHQRVLDNPMMQMKLMFQSILSIRWYGGVTSVSFHTSQLRRRRPIFFNHQNYSPLFDVISILNSPGDNLGSLLGLLPLTCTQKSYSTRGSTWEHWEEEMWDKYSKATRTNPKFADSTHRPGPPFIPKPLAILFYLLRTPNR